MIDRKGAEESPRGEALLVFWAALIFGAIAAGYCLRHGLVELYGDAVSHLYIARRIVDSRNPGLRQLGTVWLPLPHLLLAPFAAVSDWWRSGIAGAWVGVPSYAFACAGLYRLAREWLAPGFSLIALLFFALNPGLLYMAATAMTEPLYLAEMIWVVLLLVLSRKVLRENRPAERRGARSSSALAWLTLILAAAILTRYDGWILAALVWLAIAVPAVLSRGSRVPRSAWIWFTAVLIAVPTIWLAYNAAVFGDALAFLRGPYSARAIEAHTSAGAPAHPGSGSLSVAALYFLKAAEMGAVPLAASAAFLWLAFAGTVAAMLRRQSSWPLLLLWLPLPFYSYAVAYGSIPIFLPIWWPFSWYNTRYGMELLPAFALFGAFLAAAGFHAFRWSRERARFATGRISRVEPIAFTVLLLLILLNSVLLLRDGPLVYREAQVNSRSRIPFDRALANSLLALPQEGAILMDSSRFPGALQLSGIPLKRLINEADGHEWNKALGNPASAAPIVVAFDGGALARAVERRPDGLFLIQVICSTGEPCARVYSSKAFLPAVRGGRIQTGGDG